MPTKVTLQEERFISLVLDPSTEFFKDPKAAHQFIFGGSGDEGPILLQEQRIQSRGAAVEKAHEHQRGIQALMGIASGVSKRRKMVVKKDADGNVLEREETTDEPAFADRIRAVVELARRGIGAGTKPAPSTSSDVLGIGLTGLE